MVSDIQEVTFSSLSRISCDQLPTLVSHLSQTNLAFGFLKISENEFRFAVSPSEKVMSFSGLVESKQIIKEGGFVAFPFDKNKHQGFLIPNEINPFGLDFQDFYPKKKASLETQLPKETAENQYKLNTEKAVREIQDGHFQKLVLARKKSVPMPEFDIQFFLERLLKNYPKAHLVVFQLPGYGLWISASPEILLLQEGNTNLIKSMALAGTKTFAEGDDIKSQAWTEKDIEEQSLVSRFIKAKLNQIGYFQFQEKGPYSVQAGNLVHLRTDFQIVGKSENSFFELADALHPTSAVCGSPRKKAHEWLFENEGFDRSFFSGYGGFISQDVKKLVVLLRVCCWQDGILSFFSGAGITEQSDPEKEWIETGEKLKTLMQWI
jgi:isochorismate synthase EntC